MAKEPDLESRWILRMLAQYRADFAELGLPVRRLLASESLTVLAIMVGQVAIPWWITREGGSWQLSIWAVVQSAASIAAMPLLSPLSDRYPKSHLIACALLVSAVAALGTAWLATEELYRFGPLVLLQLVSTLALAVITPAAANIAAELVPPSDLPRAFALQQGANSMGRLVGPVIGGYLLALLGLMGALWAQVLLLLAAAGAALLLPVTGTLAPSRRTPWWSEVKAGFRATWLIPLERGWLIINALSWMFIFPMFSMFLPLKVQSLRLSAVWLGLCEASLSLGMLVAALGVSQAIVRRHGRYATRIGSALVQSLSFAIAAQTQLSVILLVSLFVAGVANATTILVGMTHRVLARPPAFRGRMVACAAVTVQLSATLGPSIAAVALTRWTVDAVFLSFASAAGVISLGLVLVPGVRSFMAMDPAAVENWYERSNPEAFREPVERRATSAGGRDA